MITDAWGHVCSYLDPKTIVSLSAVNRKLRGVAQEVLKCLVLVNTKEAEREYKKTWRRVTFINTHEPFGKALANALNCVPVMRDPLHFRRVVVVCPDACALAREEETRLEKDLLAKVALRQDIVDHEQSVFDALPEDTDDPEYWSHMLHVAYDDVDHFTALVVGADSALKNHRRLACALRELMKKI